MKKFRLRPLLIFIAAVFFVGYSLLFAACAKSKNEDTKEETKGETFFLSFGENSEFKVLQLADIQVSTIAEVEDTFLQLNKMVEHVKPDLLVLTGDQVDIWDDEGKEVFYSMVEKIDAYGVPWCPVFGNHDDQYEALTKEEMSQAFLQAENCIFADGPEDVTGTGNYVVNLFNMNSVSVEYSLIMMDSNSYSMADGIDYIRVNQIDWYRSKITEARIFNRGFQVPSFTFFHIPLQEFRDAIGQLQNGGEGWGTIRENVGCSSVNSGFFTVMRELGSTKAVICGHDHVNNCVIPYKGIDLCYGLKSSRGSYFDEDMLGCTLLTLRPQGDYDIKNVYFSELSA